MLQELLSIFRSQNPLAKMGENFSEMLAISLELVKRAGDIFFTQDVDPEHRTQLQQQDVRVNKLQRRIRKQVIFHLSVEGNAADLPYCLLLMSLVKDVERIGDYAKEIAELATLSTAPMPNDQVLAELKEIRGGIEADFEGAVSVLSSVDRERAVELIRCGQDTVDRCQQLIGRIANGWYSAGAATTLALGTRFYQRIAGHVLNLLSSVVMPLHKLDYYDEKDIAKAEKLQA